MPDAPVIRRYRRLAGRHDCLHRRWLRNGGGGEAQCAFEAAVRSLLQPGSALLDVGCGTGQFARRLQAQFGDTITLTLLDACADMLAQASDLDADRLVGRMENLPFEDGQFDMVTCAWALETVVRTRQTISELLRVVRPGGHVCLAFCATVENPGLPERLMQATIRWRGTGAFFRAGEIEAALERGPVGRVLRLPCAGPATVLLVRKAWVEPDLAKAA